MPHVSGISTDIAERKRAEQKLRQDEQELRRITDAIPQTIIVLGPDFRRRVFHPEDVERLQDERQKALLRGIPFENEQRARRKDGQCRWFLIRYNPLRDEQGHTLRWYATGTDIEDRN